MRCFTTFSARLAIALAIFALAACGTKPKNLKSESAFPVAYPAPATQGLPDTPQPAAADMPSNPSIQSPVPTNPASP